MLGLLAVSLSVNVLLGLTVLRLASASPAQIAVEGPRPSGLSVGAKAPSMTIERTGGSVERLDFSASERPTLIYVFSPQCRWCTRNLDNLKAVIASAQASHHVLAISLDPEVGNYLRTNGLNVPVYINPRRETIEAYLLGPTPHTLVISSQGTVLKSWTGAYGGTVAREVEEYFGLSLPGLSATTTVSER
jgi:peroxiredoxin